MTGMMWYGHDSPTGTPNESQVYNYIILKYIKSLCIHINSYERIDDYPDYPPFLAICPSLDNGTGVKVNDKEKLKAGSHP